MFHLSCQGVCEWSTTERVGTRLLYVKTNSEFCETSTYEPEDKLGNLHAHNSCWMSALSLTNVILTLCIISWSNDYQHISVRVLQLMVAEVKLSNAIKPKYDLKWLFWGTEAALLWNLPSTLQWSLSVHNDGCLAPYWTQIAAYFCNLSSETCTFFRKYRLCFIIS